MVAFSFDYQPCIDRISTVYQPYIYRISTVYVQYVSCPKLG